MRNNKNLKSLFFMKSSIKTRTGHSCKLFITAGLSICFLLTLNYSFSQKIKLNELEYFETRGVNVFVFNNQYIGMFFDEKTAGIEIIHHGVRTATGGAVRLQETPEQWDLVPTVVERKTDNKNNKIEVVLRYNEFNFDSRIIVTAIEDDIQISVFLDNPLPKALEGKAGFNLEFLPSAYFEKTYLIDGNPGIFPLYPSGNTLCEPISNKIPQYAGHTTFDDRGKGEYIVPLPLASGKTIVLAPEDPERYVKIQSESIISLFDGRNLAQNGWFIVRSLLPSQKTGQVLQWNLKINAIPGWVRKPVIQFSQVGYHPNQEKIAVFELDKNDIPLTKASLFKITAVGKQIEKLTDTVRFWGSFLRYKYLKFDFSTIKEPGLYFLKYGDQQTNTFVIDQNVYKNIWHPTLDVWFPVQMDHMKVNEAYRTWHGVPYLDDALQAPLNHQHFDGYKMGPTTDTKYKPLEHIPGLAVGGWFDAGDFDIQTPSHCSVILNFVNAWEEFGIDRDQTYIDQTTRYVDIHRPDGKPDLLQQIEHGTLNLVAQVKNIGHPAVGIIVPNLHQYHHLGDASTITDNLIYNPNLKPYESDGKTSGNMDDRWVFTNRSQWLDYQTIAALASASRALKNFNSSLAADCINEAKRLWDENKNMPEVADTFRRFGFSRNMLQLNAALQLYITTKDVQFSEKFKELIWQALDQFLPMSISAALQAIPYMDKDFKNQLKKYVIKYKELNENYLKENPYGVPIMTRGWGGNTSIISWAITNYYAFRAFPEIIGPEYVYKGLNYIFGCHPYSDISFVSSVGTRSKKITYGNNRADFRFIAGGVVPGILILKPDFPENKEDWPFLWGENECVIDTGSAYIFLAEAAKKLLEN